MRQGSVRREVGRRRIRPVSRECFCGCGRKYGRLSAKRGLNYKAQASRAMILRLEEIAVLCREIGKPSVADDWDLLIARGRQFEANFRMVLHGTLSIRHLEDPTEWRAWGDTTEGPLAAFQRGAS